MLIVRTKKHLRHLRLLIDLVPEVLQMLSGFLRNQLLFDKPFQKHMVRFHITLTRLRHS